MRKIFTALFLASTVVLAACAGNQTTVNNIAVSAKPLIDTLVPATVETASFALG